MPLKQDSQPESNISFAAPDLLTTNGQFTLRSGNQVALGADPVLQYYAVNCDPQFPTVIQQADVTVTESGAESTISFVSGVTPLVNVHLIGVLDTTSFTMTGNTDDGTQILSGNANPNSNTMTMVAQYSPTLPSGQTVDLVTTFLASTANGQSWASQDFQNKFPVTLTLNGATTNLVAGAQINVTPILAGNISGGYVLERDQQLLLLGTKEVGTVNSQLLLGANVVSQLAF